MKVLSCGFLGSTCNDGRAYRSRLSAEVFQFDGGPSFESGHPAEVPQSITAGNASLGRKIVEVALTRFETIRFSRSVFNLQSALNGDGINDFVQPPASCSIWSDRFPC